MELVFLIQTTHRDSFHVQPHHVMPVPPLNLNSDRDRAARLVELGYKIQIRFHVPIFVYKYPKENSNKNPLRTSPAEQEAASPTTSPKKILQVYSGTALVLSELVQLCQM